MKHLVSFLIVILCCLSTLSCSNKEDEPQPTNPDAVAILGTWKITHYGNVNYWTEWTKQTTSITFNKDGSFSARGYFGSGNGTYKINNKHITCYIDGNVYINFDIISIVQGTEAIYSMYFGLDSTDKITIKCRKV